MLAPLSIGRSASALLREALASLRTLGKRSILALLGIAIASASVIAMINIGHNATADAIAIFTDMGADTMIANIAHADEHQAPLPLRLDTDQVHSAVPHLSHIAPIAQEYAEVAFRDQSPSAQLVGTTPDLAAAMQLELREGRFLSSYDHKETFAVVGQQLAQTLGSTGSPLRLGDRIRIDNYLFVVIGLLHSQPDALLLPVRANDSLFIPLEGMRRIRASAQINNVILRVAPDQDMGSLAPDLSKALEQQLGRREVEIRIPQQMIDGMKSQTRTFSYLLMALGGISLVGAGVGIMNVMLMNVSQRRREIGVRMALGARRKDIRNLFLVEAMTLTAVGALLGAVLGVACAFIYARLVGWGFALAPTALPLGLGSTLLVGLFFGLYPALAAARLQPVKALRDE